MFGQAIESTSMVHLVYTRLRDAITRGELRPGEKIPQDRIALDLNVSRIPIREALRKLEEQGFVKIIPHRGAIVTPWEIHDIEETYLIRATLEGLAAAQAAVRMDRARLERLREILDAARRAFKNKDHSTFIAKIREFHTFGYEACDYANLRRMVSSLRDQCERYLPLHSPMGARAEHTLEEHERILEAWTKRDPAAAEKCTRTNLLNSGKALMAAIQAKTKVEHPRANADNKRYRKGDKR